MNSHFLSFNFLQKLKFSPLSFNQWKFHLSKEIKHIKSSIQRIIHSSLYFRPIYCNLPSRMSKCFNVGILKMVQQQFHCPKAVCPTSKPGKNRYLSTRASRTNTRNLSKESRKKLSRKPIVRKF